MARNNQLSARIVSAVADASNTDPLDLPPIYNAINPDSLNTLFHNTTIGNVGFAYADCYVTVTADEQITITENAERAPTPHAAD